jgi:hypothetical protein
MAGSDSIHDQTTYLEKEDLEKLKNWSNVESYPILQFLGDAVFIPSGAPHQVIKIFILFESFFIFIDFLLGEKFTFMYKNC